LLLLGSLFLFHRGIVPFTNYLRQAEITEEQTEALSSSLLSVTDLSIWSFYHALWIFPIWIICYASSLGWYQSIASSSYRLHHGMPKARPLKQTIITTIYATLVWLMTYLQTMAFYKIAPLMIELLVSFIDYSLTPSSSTSSSVFLLLTLLRHSLTAPLLLLSAASTAIGFLMTSVLYGWYPHEMIWLSSPSSKLESSSDSPASSLTPLYNRVETYWLYFLGYGLPYTLLFRYSSFFVGYGVYLMVFPLSIMMSCVSDFRYRRTLPAPRSGAKVLEAVVLPPFRLFRWSQYGANALLQHINRQVMRSQRPVPATPGSTSARKKTK
jgi:hypothetical protein